MTIYDHVQAIVEPIIVEALMAAILALLAWIGRHVPAWMRLKIDAVNRQALHSALETGTALALDTVQGIPTVAAADAAVTTVIGYVRRSVPGALRHFLPTDQQLVDMARAKVAAAIAERKAAAEWRAPHIPTEGVR